MKDPFARWVPLRDPIHSFVHYFDVLAGMVACHRWRPRLPDLPPTPPGAGGCPPPQPGTDPDVHPVDIASAERIAAHADAAVAAYARLGQPGAAPAVMTAADLMSDFHVSYSRHPCPCDVCPDCGGRPQSQPCEYALAVEYARIRQTLLHFLALGGQTVPRHARSRGATLTQLLRAEALPPDPHDFLRHAVAVVVSDCRPPHRMRKWTAAHMWQWVDRMAGPPGCRVSPAWTMRRMPNPGEGGPEPPQEPEKVLGTLVVRRSGGAVDAVWSACSKGGGPTVDRVKLRSAHRAILTALQKAAVPLPGKKLASATGYKAGTIRRHTGPMQAAGLIRWTPDGYVPTAAGLAALGRVSGNTPDT